MKFYRTKENNLINLEEVTIIYRDPRTDLYNISTTDGRIFEMPEITQEDIDKIMEYNNFFINN